MNASVIVKESMARVADLRGMYREDVALGTAAIAVKAFQSARFAGTYGDLLSAPEFSNAARFFLVELYSDKDYSERDRQFARIAGTIQKFFPQSVVDTAVLLARLHRLSEDLDMEMARIWLTSEGDPVCRYVTAWKTVGRESDRRWQLEAVLTLGRDLDRLTRKPGLRLMLRMMRRPAHAAGLGSLQSFLEAGFDTFASMSGVNARVARFLSTIEQRESEWMDRLFDRESTACAEALRHCLCESSSAHR